MENRAEFPGCGKLIMLFVQFYLNMSVWDPTNKKMYWFALMKSKLDKQLNFNQ